MLLFLLLREIESEIQFFRRILDRGGSGSRGVVIFSVDERNVVIDSRINKSILGLCLNRTVSLGSDVFYYFGDIYLLFWMLFDEIDCK